MLIFKIMLMFQSIFQKTVLAITLCFGVIYVYGQNVANGDEMYLYTNSSDEAVIYSINDINKITFSENGVQIWNTNWPTEYSFSTVGVLTFNGKTPSAKNDKISITISSAKQLAYVSDKDLDFYGVKGLKAYVATGYDKTSGTIWLTRVNSAPAKTGMLIMGEAGTYDIPVSAAASNSYYKNLFKYTLSGMTLQTTDGDYTNYYLSNGASGIGFYKVTNKNGVKLGANRAYLSIPSNIAAVGKSGQKETITVSAAGQVPYYSSKSLDFTNMDKIKAYTATGYNYKTGTIWLTRVKKVPAETGVLIMAPKGSYDVPTASVASVYTNIFKGALTAQKIYTTETIAGTDYVNYYLSKGSAGVGFYKVTSAEGVSMGANRCYLSIPKRETVAGTRGINDVQADDSFHFLSGTDDVIGIQLYNMGGGSDNTTGINSLDGISDETDEYYNVQGQRVDTPKKGFYIKNGKKVFVK